MIAQQLKASILQLAIQGKLVPQNPADEPASVLLKRIKAEKDALVKAGKLKKDKHESIIIRNDDGRYLEKKDGKTTDITDEIPFDVPESWEWTRMVSIGQTNIGLTYKPSDITNDGTGIPVLRSNNIQNGHLDLSDLVRVSCIVADNLILNETDILICARNGSKSLVGKCAVIPSTKESFSFGAFMAVFRSQLNQWVFYVLNSSYFRNYLFGSNSTQICQLTQDMLKKLLLPLPPVEEQARIVAKIEELLPHVAEYGKAETEISKLNAELPEQMKKSILQWAIQGRLVPQDPTDEPASELLKRIKAEKSARIKSGKLKKEKPLPPISEDEIPFDIPDTWTWVRLGTVLLPTGSKLPSGDFFDYIDIDAVDNSINRISSPKRIPVKNAPSRASREIAPGDVLFSLVRPYLKNIALVMDEHKDCIASTGFFVCRPSCGVDKEYLFYSMISSFVVNGINAHIKGDNSPSVRKEDIQNQLFPLPPLAEQKRIVEKLETILSTLDVPAIV